MIDHRPERVKSGSRPSGAARCGERSSRDAATNWRGSDRSCPGCGSRRSTASRPTKAPRPSTISSEALAAPDHRFMFGPEYTAGCRHARRSRTASTASRASRTSRRRVLSGLAGSLEKLQAYKQRMGWTFRGLRRSRRLQLRLRGGVHRGAATSRSRGVRLPRDEHPHGDRRRPPWPSGTSCTAFRERGMARSRSRTASSTTYSAYRAGLMASGPCIRGSTARHRRNETIVRGYGDLRAAIWFAAATSTRGDAAGSPVPAAGFFSSMGKQRTTEPADLAPVPVRRCLPRARPPSGSDCSS